jgi:hypothetical protein
MIQCQPASVGDRRDVDLLSSLLPTLVLAAAVVDDEELRGLLERNLDLVGSYLADRLDISPEWYVRLVRSMVDVACARGTERDVLAVLEELPDERLFAGLRSSAAKAARAAEADAFVSSCPCDGGRHEDP